MISYNVPIDAQRMTIGVQGENNVRQFLFDVTEWRQLTGNIGAAEMVVQRAGDSSPYATVITMKDENTVSWVPTSVDTAKVGAGKIQLMWFAGTQIVKTKIFDMKVDPALDYKVPDDSLDPWASWMPGIINADANYKGLTSRVDDLQQRQTSPYNFKGAVATLADLPSTGQEVNDTYYVEAVKYRVTWTGSAWQQSSMDESDYEDDLADAGQTDSMLSRAVADLRERIGSSVEHFVVKSPSGWSNKGYFFQGRTLEANVTYYFAVDLNSAPSSSTYIKLTDDTAGTDLNYRQANGLTHVEFKLTPTERKTNVSCCVDSNAYNDYCHLTVSTSIPDRVTEDEDRLLGIAAEAGNVSLLRYAPFFRSGNYVSTYYDYQYMVSSRTPITADDDWYIAVDDGYAFQLVLIADDESISIVTWRRKNYYVQRGTRFVLMIRADPLDYTATADVADYVSRIRIYNTRQCTWHVATDYCDLREGSKKIDLTGEKVDAPTYFRVYSFKNPTFRRIRARISCISTEILEIAFFRSETPSAESLDGEHSIAQEAPYWGAKNQAHTICADVPEDCRLVCVTTRRLLNDDTPFEPEICVDDVTPYLRRELQQQSFGLEMLNGYRLICHLFADKIGSGDYLIPCQSMPYIDMAHRLGYRMIELNVHPTATPGKYVCMHGSSGTIGDELVARDGSDISSLRFEDVEYATFRDDYVYNTTVAKYRTHITFLDDALRACKRYSIVPLLSFADYDMFDAARAVVGDNFAVLVYDDHYLQRHLWKGAFQRYGRQAGTAAEVDALCKAVGAPFLFGITNTDARDLTKAQLQEYVDVVHANGCLIGVCGAYQSAATNYKLSGLGLDYDATGYEVEPFDTGNLVNLADNGTFADFYHDGQVEDGILTMGDGDYLSSAIRETPFLAKAELIIRFSGTIRLDMGEYVSKLPITSDGEQSVHLAVAYVNYAPNFTAQAVGQARVMECSFKASKC